MNMNIKYLKTATKAAVLVTALSCGVNLRAATPSTPQTLGGSAVGQNQYQTVAFSDSAEAGMMHRAYRILATGDHDYKGHRVKAMRQIESAAKLLGLDLSGDLKDRQPQALSDVKLREAQGLLSKCAWRRRSQKPKAHRQTHHRGHQSHQHRPDDSLTRTSEFPTAGLSLKLAQPVCASFLFCSDSIQNR